MKIVKSGAPAAYRASRYNLAVSDSYTGGTILYNEITNAVALLTKEEYRSFRKGEYDPEVIRQGFAVPQNKDEKRILQKARIQGLTKTTQKRVTILTTTACNARCYYCFEKGTAPVTMTENVMEDAAAFLIRLCKETETKDLSLMWFGGEPLLHTAPIDRITERLRDASIFPTASITTNGSLITPELAKKMKGTWNVRSVQITLDGTEEVYNRAKNYRDPKQYHFQTVLANIKTTLRAGIHVTLRLNYDTKNEAALEELMHFLGEEFAKEKGKRLSVYLNTILPTAGYPTKTVADAGFLRLHKLAVSEGLCSLESLLRFGFRKINCPMRNRYAFSIGPSGELSRCYEVTDRYPIGDIWQGVTNLETDALWTSPEVSAQCEECVYLPLCQGGCPVYPGNSRCTKSLNQKEIIEHLLIYYVHEKDKRKDNH